MAERQFTSNQVIELTGITARQLQWWDERGLVVPARQGRNRLYSADDLAEIAVLSELRRKGFSLQRVRKIMRFIQKELGKRLVETVTSGAEYHLLTDGKQIYLENSAHEIIDILKNARQPIMSICLSDAVRQIQSEIHSEMRASAGEVPAARRRPRSAEQASRQARVKRTAGWQ
jgi:DNA-binding transcriptional MerR regulator